MNSQLPNSPPSINEWPQQVIDACDFYDTNRAFSLLRQWDEMIRQMPEPQKSKIARLKEKLFLIAFPELPLNQAVEIIEKRLLSILGGEIDINEILKKRFLYLGYGNQEEDRLAFRNAALKNQQILGGKKVSEWLQEFDKAFPPEGLEETAAGKFFTQYPPITSLSKTEQAYLKRLFQVYGEWLRVPLVTIFDTVVVYKKLVELEKEGVKEVDVANFKNKYLQATPQAHHALGSPATHSQTRTQTGETASLPLLSALSKYHQVALHQITRERIKLKTQVEPVRPTLMNWLKYYRSELGIGYHDSVKRGEFLYRSENGRRLSDEERERLSLILKSVEEDFPMQIDTVRSEIVFPDFEEVPRRRAVFSDRETHLQSTFSQNNASIPEAPRQIRPQEIPLAKPLSFHQGGIPRSHEVEETPEMPVARWRAPEPEKAASPSSGFAFRELPEIPGIKPAPAFVELQRGKPAWKASKPQVSAENLTFSSPHVFPAEKERKDNWLRQQERQESTRQPRSPERKVSSQIPPVSVPPTPSFEPGRVKPAPRRKSELPRPQFQSPPNRFNITPVSYRGEDDKNEL